MLRSWLIKEIPLLNFVSWIRFTGTAAFLAAVFCVFTLGKIDQSFASSLDQIRPLIDRYEYSKYDEWSRILFYHPSVFGKPSSLIDSPDFFISPNGSTDPKAELLEFAKKALSDDAESRKVQCRFPRRTQYLRKILASQNILLPDANCPIWKPMNPTGLYVVFSSYFLESPASYFGHIFLRVERKSDLNNYNPLLDPIISFGAKHGDANLFRYIAGGLLGWFPGVYEISPMHTRIQQYNNYESRDLWEYRLNLSRDQLHDLELSLFEVLPTYSDYYYLSRNCSLLIAKLIEAVEPSVQFSAGSRIWTSPIEAMKQLVEALGDSKPSAIRASSRRRYLAKANGLTSEELDLVRRMISQDQMIDISSLQADRQAEVLETLIEFVEFDQNLAGPARAEKYALLRQKALFARAKNPAETKTEISIPDRENPMLIIPEKSVRMGAMRSANKNYALLGIRPSLKSLNSTSQGFLLGMGIHVFDIDIYANEQTVGIHEFDLLLLENYQTAIPLKSGIGGGIRLSFGRLYRQPEKPYSFDLEFSRNFGWGNSFAMVFLEYGIFSHILAGKDRNQLGVFPSVGFVAEWESVIKVHGKVRTELNAMQKFRSEPILDIGLSTPLNNLNDFEFNGKFLRDSYSVSLRYNRFLR